MADKFVLGVEEDRALVSRAIGAMKALWWMDRWTLARFEEEAALAA